MLLTASFVFFVAIHHRVVGDFDRMLEVEADMLVRNTERKGRTVVWDVPDTYSQGSRQTKDPAYCQLFLENGTVVGLSQTLGADDLPRIEGRVQVVQDAKLPDGRRGRILQKTFRPTADDTDPQTGAEDPLEQNFVLPADVKAADLHLVLVVDRVEKAFEKERRFSSDLAHELRTPIAELRTACEVGARWPDDVEETRQFFQDTGIIALQLEKSSPRCWPLAAAKAGRHPCR